MRAFETNSDMSVLPGVRMVARVDGRGFTRLTKERHTFEAPFDVRFRDFMIATVKHLMQCGVGFEYGYTQSDEISLLFVRDESSFGRKLRKLNSVLAGEASAAFTHALGSPAAFDCRISQLPRDEDVVDYFRWRQDDAARNALSGHCYWLLRRRGLSQREATRRLDGASVSERNELLFDNGINFDALPSWQKRGVGIYWQDFEHSGFNPRLGREVMTTRRSLAAELELPMKDAYADYVFGLLSR